MGVVSLTGPQYAQLHEAVRRAFNYNELQMCVRTRLGERLDEFVAAREPFNTQVTQLLDWAEKEGNLRELVAALRQDRRGNSFLAAAERDIFGTPGMALTATEAGAEVKRAVESRAKANPKLQALLGGRPGLPVDVGDQEERWRRAKAGVARVECPEGTAVATGFLVGPDLLLTNQHVREGADFDKSPRKVCVRFGYARAAGVADPGATYKLADDWLVAASPVGELDYCLARLAAPAGDDPSGRYVTAPPRGWLVRAADAVQKGDIVTVLGHPRGVAMTQASGVVTDLPAGWLDYAVNTLPGSSGSPVLNERWELVGLHSREGDVESNTGVSLAAILKELPDDVRDLVGRAS